MKCGMVGATWPLLCFPAAAVRARAPQIVIINSQASVYVQNASRNFYYFFYPADYDFST